MFNYRLSPFIWVFPLLFLISCSAHKGFKGATIHLHVTDISDELVLLEDVATTQKVIIDSARLKDYSARFQVYAQSGIYRLRIPKNDKMLFIYIRDGNQLTVEWNTSDNHYSVNGNQESQQIKSMIVYSNENAKHYENIRLAEKKDSTGNHTAYFEHKKEQNRKDLIHFVETFIDSVKNADVAAFALNYVGSNPDNIAFLIDKSDEIYHRDTTATYATMWFKSLDGYRSQLLSRMKNGLQIGIKAPEIVLPDFRGDTVSLKSFLGQYVLLDFWASWCQPCRKENPNLVEAYKKFKNRKFTIVSVSLDIKKEQWEKGIKLDHLIWPNHLSDLQRWRSPVVKEYQVNSIPLNFLLDPSGKIIAKDLRGAYLQSTLDNLLPPEPLVDTLPVLNTAIQ